MTIVISILNTTWLGPASFTTKGSQLLCFVATLAVFSLLYALFRSIDTEGETSCRLHSEKHDIPLPRVDANNGHVQLWGAGCLSSRHFTQLLRNYLLGADLSRARWYFSSNFIKEGVHGGQMLDWNVDRCRMGTHR